MVTGYLLPKQDSAITARRQLTITHDEAERWLRNEVAATFDAYKAGEVKTLALEAVTNRSSDHISKRQLSQTARLIASASGSCLGDPRRSNSPNSRPPR
jgi:hypothetical protein